MSFIKYNTIICLFFILLGGIGEEVVNAKTITYSLKIKQAQISSKNKSHSCWDSGWGAMKAPDVFVVIKMGAFKIKTSVIKNSLNPRWNDSRIVRLNGNEKIKISVYDKDIHYNDLIGHYESKVSKLFNSHSLSFGKVLSLKIAWKRINETNPQTKIKKRRQYIRGHNLYTNTPQKRVIRPTTPSSPQLKGRLYALLVGLSKYEKKQKKRKQNILCI